MDVAHQSFARGQFRQAAGLLAGARAFEARVLLAECRRQLGNLATARRQIEDLGQTGPAGSDFLRLAEVAVALYRDLEDVDAQEIWADKGLRLAASELRPRAELLAAEIAQSCQRNEAVKQHLDAAAPICGDPRFSWRWNRLRALDCLEHGDTKTAKSALRAALGGSRRVLAGFQAAGLWRRLAQIRLELGELEAAQRAATHALRLLGGVEGEERKVRGLRLLMEIRLRRGIGDHADTVLQMGSAGPEDPALVALWARWDLLRGRPAAALRRIRRFSGGRHGVGTPDEEAVLKLLECRALGWLGRDQEAREGLEELPESAWKGLEREELPAVWALSGDWRRARDLASGTGVDELWSRLLDRGVVEDRNAKVLAELSAYRSARVVFDMELLAPETLPEMWRDQASFELRRVGAGSFAERLGRQRSGPWLALAGYLTPKPADSVDVAALFSDAGYFDVHLSFQSESEKRVLVDGSGGDLKLTAPSCGGHLVLRSQGLDPALRTLFALATREYRVSRETGRRAPRIAGILGDSESLRRALYRLERLAATEVAVLIQGETGTGKELAARQLHALGPRASQAFVAVNCAALSESLLLSDLFGHVRGAFTGADRDRAGLFETAAGGTVFLDEIGDLPHTAQGKLLRVLQEGEVRRLGESLPRRVDVRVVAATHQDLGAMVTNGRFRRDLYYRLKVGSVVLPPLRQRGGDVLLLADHFLRPVGLSMTHRARQRLLHHPWPGNVRELRNVLQVAVALTERDVVDVEDLELPREKDCGRLGYHQQVEEFRRGLVKQALAASDGNRAEAARRLDLSRQALSYLVRNLGLG
jgi:two-component system NtrC family response regulator